MNRYLSTCSDREFIEAVRRRDWEVMSAFYQRCRSYYEEKQSHVFDLVVGARNEEDLFQDSFLTLWNEIETGRIHLRDGVVCRFDKEGVSRRMGASLQTYLMSIAKYKNKEIFREAELYTTVDDDTPDQFKEDAPEMTLEDILSLQLNDLPKRCRDLIKLFYFEGLPLDELLKARRETYANKDSLKNAKSKCLSRLKSKVMEECRKYHLSPSFKLLNRAIKLRDQKYDLMHQWEEDYQSSTRGICCCEPPMEMEYASVCMSYRKPSNFKVWHEIEVWLRIHELWRKGRRKEAREMLLMFIEEHFI